MLFLVHANRDHSSDSTELLKQEFKEFKEQQTRKWLFFLMVSLCNISSSLPFQIYQSVQMSSVVVWHMKSWVASAHFPKSHCRLGMMKLSFLGCLFYVSSDLLFRGKKKQKNKKNLCWCISASNKPKLGLGFDLNVCNSLLEEDRKPLSTGPVLGFSSICMN